MKHFLLKDFNYDCQDATKLIDEAAAANVIKSVIFNGKIAYRIVRADCVAVDTVLVPKTQESDGNDEQNIDSVIFEESLTSQIDSLTLREHQESDDDSISIIVENKLWFAKLEGYLKVLSCRFENLPIYLCSYKNNTLKNPHF